MVPGGSELFGPDAALPDLAGFEKVQRQVPQGGQVLRRVPGACPAFVLAHLHIQHPVQLILHARVPSARRAQKVSTPRTSPLSRAQALTM